MPGELGPRQQPLAPEDMASQATSSGVWRKLAGTQTQPSFQQAKAASNIWLQLADCTNKRSPLRMP